MSDIEILQWFRDEIYTSGNSHHPEAWAVASSLGVYIERLETESTEEVLEAARTHRDELDDPHCEHEAPETLIAVLTGEVDSSGCNGCGRGKSVSPKGYCHACREIYGRES